MPCYEDEFSPTDTSEDSIEISIKPSHKKFTKNKRKSVEPRRVKIQNWEREDWKLEEKKRSLTQDYNENEFSLKRKSPSPSHLAPKKRFKFDAMLEMEQEKIKEEQIEFETKPSLTPFRPWADTEKTTPVSPPSLPHPNLPFLLNYLRVGNLVPEQDEPLALVVEKKSDPESISVSPSDLRVKEEILNTSDSDLSCYSPSRSSGKKQTNYKSMTKDRRVEANARERQRVHTITAAFDTLQAAIPSEDENIKLSNISVIKIATAYIMALSRMAGYDYTEDRSAPSLESVLEHCRETIHTETKIKNRKLNV